MGLRGALEMIRGEIWRDSIAGERMWRILLWRGTNIARWARNQARRNGGSLPTPSECDLATGNSLTATTTVFFQMGMQCKRESKLGVQLMRMERKEREREKGRREVGMKRGVRVCRPLANCRVNCGLMIGCCSCRPHLGDDVD